MILQQDFYKQNTVEVAQKLLGKVLVRDIGNHLIKGKIVETEAYSGFDDKASHAHKGKTPRNSLMFGPAGFTYIYLTYGMHNLLNIVTEDVNYPAAVLIRAVEPITELEIIQNNRKGRSFYQLTSGPAKLTKALDIDRKLNGINITSGKDLWIEDYENIEKESVESTTRIGVNYAEECKGWLRRFYVKENKFVSKI